MKCDHLLIVADSLRDADMLYAVRMFVPDPLIYLRMDGRCHLVVGDLELDRARKQAPHCRAISLSQCWNRLRQQGVRRPHETAQVIRLLLRERRIRRVVVPENFPLGLARSLRDLKVKLKVTRGGVFPQRALKSPEEVKKISAAQLMAEVGLAEGIQALKQSRISRDRKLIYRNAAFTSERLRAIIDTAIVQAGGQISHTIVAGGRQGCDPHEVGHGPLLADEPIVLDIFPRSQRTGYHGDITRTVVRGRASDAVRRAFQAVQEAQEVAFRMMKSAASCRKVHEGVQEHFRQRGYKTSRTKGAFHGFFHGTGHGIGLELHEAPNIGPRSQETLANRMTVTVEPGLYYPEMGGGVRLEDVVVIQNGRPKNLTKFEKVLEV
jgi:Xaa-Pro aminopeptidase